MKRHGIRNRWRWPAKLVAGLVVAAAFCVLIEGVLRLFLGAPPHPIMVRSMLGNHDSYFTDVDGYLWTTYQGAEPDRPCPPFSATTDRPRIAVLGASSVRTGVGVAIEDRFSELITERTGVDTLNLGCSGADSHDLVGILGQLLNWPVTMVVVYSGHCDVGNAYLLQRYSNAAGWATAKLQPLLEHSQLFVQYRRLLSPVSRTAPPGVSENGLRKGEIAALERDFERNLNLMASMCKSAEVPLVLVVPVSDLTHPPPPSSSAKGQRAEELWQQGLSLLPSDPEGAVALLEAARDASPRPVRASAAVEDIVRRVAAEQNVPLVAARRDLPRDPNGVVTLPSLFVDEIHLSAAGHEALADLLVPVIRSELPPGVETEATEPIGDDME